MMTIFKTNINWTKLAIAFVLLFFAFSFSSTAQTNSDKPMSATALTGLIDELKGVVLKSGADEKAAALVADRWNKRTDLKGKTKKEVINLLYQDVKAVITDSGIQYQIYSIFSFYKQIPDESPAAETQKTNGSLSKGEPVRKLIELTYQAHPWVIMPKPWAAKKEDETIKQKQLKVLDDALAVNKELTPEQKLFVKANYDKLRKIVDKQVADAEDEVFPFEQWAKENLEQRYTAKFTDKEINGLIAYFQGTDGQNTLKVTKNAPFSEDIVKKGGAPLYTKEEEAKANKFGETPLGKKFMDAFLGETNEYLNAKMEEAGKSGAKNMSSIIDPATLNKLFNQFVRDNYKK